MEEAGVGNSEFVSRVNRGLVLQAVRASQPTFRAEVARMTRLKPATVTGIVNDLIGISLLKEIPGRVESGAKGGRPPLMLQLNESYQHILAIDLEPDWIRVAVTDILADIVSYREQLIDRFSEPVVVLRQIEELCRQVLGPIAPQTLLGAAMSLPGLIDVEQGILLSSTNLPKWRDTPVADWIEKRVGVRPKIERSTHLAALHEGWSSPASVNHERVLILSVRTGIGMSLLDRGRLYTGWNGFDGEIGHTVVDINGKACECGSHGCLETFVSASAVCDRATAMMKQGRARTLQKVIEEQQERLRPELVYRLAKEGDPDCGEVVRDMGRYIGIAASNMVNVLAPDRVVICGAIDTADDLVLQAVRDQIDRYALPSIRAHVTVGLAAAKERAPLLGAAVLVARELFELPRLRNVNGPQDNSAELEAV